jgi:hypothetical protein
MRVFLFGAGASRGYRGGRNGVPPPLAKDFFSTFVQLPIASDNHVLIGDLINYVRDTRNIPWARFGEWNEDIETFLTEVHSQIATSERLASLEFESVYSLAKTYSQMIFLFASVLNEVQDGPSYTALSQVVAKLQDEDVLITFNWDTLLDKSLYESGQWTADDGYGIDFQGVFDDSWHPPSGTRSRWKLLKLHGSTNWLMPYYCVDLERRVWKFNNESIRPEDRPVYCFFRATKPYDTYKGRYKGPYHPFAYYYYPPNVPIPPSQPPEGYSTIMQTFEPAPSGVNVSTEINPPYTESMPMLIAPIKHKDYGLMNGLIESLWSQAQAAIEQATELVIIGYSFPPTDLKAIDLLSTAVANRSDKLPITIVNPYPADIADRLTAACGSKVEVTVREQTLEEFVT